jgi:phospholipid/cholesterol/gamma-HCH transport system permease protein
MVNRAGSAVSSIFSETGTNMINIIKRIGYTLILLFKTIYYLRFVVSKRSELFKQMYIAGVKSLLVCGIVAFFTGMILALQTGIELKKFQQQQLVGNLLITTMTKEMGPFTTALIITASVGAAMAAELGTMKVTEQVDALEMMSISPIKFLVMPRVTALAIMLPVVTIYTTILGVMGGALIARFQLTVPFDLYFMRVYESLYLKDMYVGLLKAFVFSLIISGISCGNGLKAENGVLGVGEAIRSSVVASFLMILIMGYFITSIFYGEAL